MSYPSVKQQVYDTSFVDYQIGYGRSNGTFGELLQGVLPNKKSFMVTFPINLFSCATFIPDHSTSNISVYPKEKQKSARITDLILKHFEINIGGTLTITSDIPEGKGLASSSADLVATAYALQDALNLSLNAELIESFIAKIEPTDGVMYKGATSFYYKDVKLKEYIADLPEIYIVAVDEGSVIDTVDYNNINKVYTPQCPLKYEDMLETITRAIKEGDLQTIGQISTESALMNQKHNYKSFLDDMIGFCKEIKGLGVAVAHSGTFIGILLDPNSKKFHSQKDFCFSLIKQYGKVPHTFSTFACNEDKFLQKELKTKIMDQVC